MDTISIFLLGAMAFAGYLLYSWYQTTKRREEWEKTASQFGFDFDPGGWFSKMQMNGQYLGVPIYVCLYSETRGSGKNRHTVYFTEFNTTLAAPWNTDIKISKRGVGDRIAEFFGGQDLKTGDSIFDSDFRIQGSDSGPVWQTLSKDDTQLILQRLANSYNHFLLHQGSIRVRTKGSINTSQELTRQINAVVESATALNDAVSSEERQALEPASQDGGELFPSVEAGSQEPDPVPVVTDEEEEEFSNVSW